jgi:quinolinate synthase
VREHLEKIKGKDAPSPAVMDSSKAENLLSRLKSLFLETNSCLIAHYYTEGAIQDLAEASGGFVGDSLEMARFGRDCGASNLIVAGVRFMGETAKILSPTKRVFMPTLEATCSLDLACSVTEFSEFCDQHPDHTVVVYANTSAAVKARADWVVTSSIAVEVIEHLVTKGQKIIWAPDKHLGRYIEKCTGAEMLIWDGACIVHEEFKAAGVRAMQAVYHDAAVLAHPESPASVLAIADFVGSTTQIIKAAATMTNRQFIVATDLGIFHKLNRVLPEKEFIVAPTAGDDATCRSCASCPWMGMNSLETLEMLLVKLVDRLVSIDSSHEIEVNEIVREQAMLPLQKMLNFAEQNAIPVEGKA